MLIHKIIVPTGILSLLFFSLSCNDSGNSPNTNNPDTTKNVTGVAYGTFTFSIKPNEQRTQLLGGMYDGPTPENISWLEVDKIGTCRLLKPVLHNCPEPCGGEAACVEGDTCQAYPKPVSVGTFKIDGFKLADGSSSLSVNPPTSLIYQVSSSKLNYPPFNEGDNLTFTASGSESSPAFTVSGKGISPLVILNDSITLADGQPIDLRWNPPSVSGISKIFIKVDLAYHGGTSARLECECDDNGSYTIPAKLLDELKSFGLAFMPKIEITRKANFYNATSKVNVILESMVLKYLKIPGMIYCNSNEGCPNGQTCDEKAEICK